MNDISSMNIIERTQDLVNEKLPVLSSQFIFFEEDCTQIRIHSLEYPIDIMELCSWGRKHNRMKIHDIRVFE